METSLRSSDSTNFRLLKGLCSPVGILRIATTGRIKNKYSLRRVFDSRWRHWKFSLTESFRSHYGRGIDSTSNRNEYQGYFVGGKGGRCVRLITLPPSCAGCRASAFWNPQGLSRPIMGLLYPYVNFNVGMFTASHRTVRPSAIQDNRKDNFSNANDDLFSPLISGWSKSRTIVNFSWVIRKYWKNFTQSSIEYESG